MINHPPSLFFESKNSKKDVVKKAVRICINCGSKNVSFQDKGIFCKDCSSFFTIEDNDE